jgi:hypothetical protein
MLRTSGGGKIIPELRVPSSATAGGILEFSNENQKTAGNKQNFKNSCVLFCGFESSMATLLLLKLY